MPLLFQIFSQSDYLIQIVYINSHAEWQTVQIMISWLLRSQLIYIYTVCKGRVYTSSAEQGLNEMYIPSQKSVFNCKQNQYIQMILLSRAVSYRHLLSVFCCCFFYNLLSVFFFFFFFLQSMVLIDYLYKKLWS